MRHSAAHLVGMTFARAALCTPTSTRCPASTAPGFPDRADLAAAWPNRYQRLDALNERLYAIAAHPESGDAARLRACREAIHATWETHTQFDSLPANDLAAARTVRDAARCDTNLRRALSTLGALEDYEARTFGARVAEALYYDVEALISTW